MLNCFSAISLPTLGEMEQTISLLERGTIATKLYINWNTKHKLENKKLMLIRETRQLLWSSATADTRLEFDGSLDLREVKEIRVGKNSKEFSNFIDETKKYDCGKCFVILYGNSFNLDSFSVVALSEQECENWVKGLKYMVKDTINASYPLQLERWLRREYYAIANANQTKGLENMTLKNLKAFLKRVNCNMSIGKLMELFSEDDARRTNSLRFDDFSSLLQKLLLPQVLIDGLFVNETFTYLTDGEKLNVKDFKDFLIIEQNESMGNDETVVSNFIRDFLQDVERDVQQPYLTLPEFVDYLFSKQNDLWDKNYDKVYMDMKQPMSNYWIASSHNTYLTGDQLRSESSVEAYVRALRMGCRCIELDCWNGPDNLPYIYHGHTMTSKIKFMDVIKTIKEHAFVTSEYPVILSIEQNCSVGQQRNMAQALLDVFGDMLLVQRCDRNETQLPSPYQLRRKIILKHKKLPEFEDSASNSNNSTGTLPLRSDENDNCRNILKEGKLYFKDPIDKTWSFYRFLLTQQVLIYSSETEDHGEHEDDFYQSLTAIGKTKDSLINDELHFGENWFHGKLEGGRQEADTLLEAYKHLGDGTFLVRESATFVGDYSLSFWRRNRPNHCRIKLKHENGTTKYYLVDNMVFDSLYSLIVYYRKNMLRSSEFSIILREPVPQPKKHENQEWFHPNTTKEQAEQVLSKLEIGSFLVRQSEQSSKAFVISFTVNRKIKHCRIILEGRLYLVARLQFESLVSLITYYTKNPLYKNVTLAHPVSQEVLRQCLFVCNTSLDENNGNGTIDLSSYMDPTVEDRVTCKALYSYKASEPDELSFPTHAIITNVLRTNEMWWKGDYGGMLQRLFPTNYVKVIESNNDDTSLFNDGNDANDGSTRADSIEIHGAVVSLFETNEPGISLKLQIQTSAMQNIFEIGFDNQAHALEWVQAIQDAAQVANQLESERRKRENSARVAKEMSDLIIYFRSVPFREHSWVFYEMSSFAETKAKQLIQKGRHLLLAYNRNQISRVYPKGKRFDSSNFNPVPFWNVGSQMIALNYQTGGKPMQFNQAKFRDNGACGFLLKPSFMLNESFDPNDANTLSQAYEKQIKIRIIAARHLCRAGKDLTMPLVVVEVIGAPFDSGIKLKTKTNINNGFNPVWNENCEFTIRNPYFAVLRFAVQNEDSFFDEYCACAAMYPVNCLRTGYRSVVLRNKFSEELELASLLIHISVKNME